MHLAEAKNQLLWPRELRRFSWVCKGNQSQHGEDCSCGWEVWVLCTRHVTQKSHVYCFGILALDVASGRPVLCMNLIDEDDDEAELVILLQCVACT